MPFFIIIFLRIFYLIFSHNCLINGENLKQVKKVTQIQKMKKEKEKKIIEFININFYKQVREKYQMSESKKIDYVLCNKTTSLQKVKQFSKNAILVLNKLERQIDISQKIDTSVQPKLLLPKIRIMFHSYELLLVQLNECCQVLQLQELGKFVFKIFMQIMNALESVLYQQLTLEQIQKKEKDQMLKVLREKLKNENMKEKESDQQKNRDYFVEIEKKRFEVTQIEKQLNKMEQIKSNKEQTIGQNIQKSLEKALSIQSSNAQFIIQESCYLISSKYNSFLDLIQFRRNKIKMEDPGDFQKIFQKAQYQNSTCQKTTHKLMEIVKNFIQIRENQKKQNLRSIQTQTEARIAGNDSKKQGKRKKQQQMRTQQILKLKSQLKDSQLKSNTLQRMLKQNSQKIQEQLLKQRISVFKLEQQRISIASKLARSSQFTIDFVDSQTNFQKQNAKSEFEINSEFNSRKSLSTISNEKKKLSKKKMSGIQLSREGKQTINNKKSGFQKERVSEMKIYNVFEFQMCPIRPVEIKQCDLKNTLNQKSQIGAGVQTQFLRFNQGVKQKIKPKVQKFVKFKDQHQIYLQYSLIIKQTVDQSQQPEEKINQVDDRTYQFKQIKMAESIKNEARFGYSHLLRKKKGVINWSKNLSSQLIDKTNYEINKQKEWRYSAGQNEKNRSQNRGCISQLSLSCFGLEKRNIKLEPEPKICIKTNVSCLKGLQFDIKDIQALFLTVEKAKNYQYLNYHISSQKLDNSSAGKSKRFASLHKQSQNDVQNKINQYRIRSYTSENKLSSLSQVLIGQIVKHLNRIRQLNSEKYEKVRNFMRFPLSSVTRCQQQKWIFFTKQEQKINLQQCRALLHRIQKIHSRCEIDLNLNMCHHIIFFLEKIGISLQKI